ncbi:hypothetical protein TNCV_4486881 [Trichonephila clavipes]|nr:hypothetical protein TNCV_4486881 [Trichonephila clavipes]
MPSWRDALLMTDTYASQNPNVMKLDLSVTCELQTTSDNNNLQSKNRTKIWSFDLNVPDTMDGFRIPLSDEIRNLRVFYNSGHGN